MDALDEKILSQIDEKGFVPDEVRNAFFRKLRMKSENRSCFECSARNPTWNSMTYACYLCLECSGEHRRKGVHLSFVRSVELDKFTPEQMVQMAVGGNGRAWEFFKTNGMGKTSDGGRPVDYNSKAAKRYKEMIEKDTAAACEKFKVRMKADGGPILPQRTVSASTVETAAPPAPEAPVRGVSAPSFFDDFAEPSTAESARPVAAKAPSASPVAAAPKSVALATTSTSTIKVLQMPESSPVASSLNSGPRLSSGFAAKQKAKEIDFDFDFDELEKEASKPAPAPAPKAVSAPAPVPANTNITMAKVPDFSASKPTATATTDSASKFNSAKAISSADFFNEIDEESASQRVERENRYAKFAGSGAISSSNFFGDGQEDDNDPANWKSKGSDMAKAGLTKGAELLAVYLNKVRD